MKKILFLVFITTHGLFAQNTLSVNADIQHVRVFLDRAQIDGVIKTPVGGGTTKIVVENIASTADPNSIQVGGKGDVTIMGVKFGKNFLRKGKSNPVEDSLKMTKTEIETINMLVSVATNERSMLMANSNIKTEKDGVTPEDLKEMTDYFRTKLTEIGTRQLQLEKQLNNLRDREKRLTQQLNEQSSRTQSSGEIIITVQSKGSTNIELNLSYIVTNAGWMPIYDLRAKDTKSPIALAYRTNVYQNTGIDWKNVKLTLSTANPSQGGSKAELYPQYLSVYEPQPVYVQNSRAMKKDAPQAMTMEAAPMVSMADAGSTANFVNVQESTMSVNFDIQIPYSIPSSGNPELVDIQNHSLSTDYKYSIAPKVDKDAFLISIIRDWEKLNLLPGKANVYFEGTFVGETQINGGEVTDSLVISLGRDKKIVSKREIVSEYKARKTVGSNIRETFGYKISLRNTKGEAITLTVEDQIPVSQDSRIEVELEDAKGAAFQAETGKLIWNVTLQPQESKEIIVVYNVKYPKGKQINNL